MSPRAAEATRQAISDGRTRRARTRSIVAPRRRFAKLWLPRRRDDLDLRPLLQLLADPLRLVGGEVVAQQPRPIRVGLHDEIPGFPEAKAGDGAHLLDALDHH